ncbi:MAG: hypothetical protein PUB20_08145 [Clostridia bacterium]|nr:hypothetical protein [Clostridia bacterium]
MKKTISIILTAAMLIASLLCINVSAADSKTEDLLNQMAESKSISVTVPDGTLALGNIEVKNVKISAKVFDNYNGTLEVKIAADGKVFGIFKVKIIADNGGIEAYIPLLFMKIDVAQLLGEDVDLSQYTQSVNQILEYLNSDYINCLKLNTAGEKEVEGYGNVYVEEFVPDAAAIAQKAVESGAVTLPDGVDVSQLTEQQLIAYVAIAGGDVQSIAAMFKSSAEFYYVNDNLVGFKANMVDKSGNNQVIDSAQILPVKVDSITSGVSDDVFKASGFYMDMTGFAKIIVSILAK